MPLKLHNTLTGRVEPFAPLREGEVSFYSCGPTVYDYAHIGNFRSFLAADLLRRWLESPLCERVDAAGKPTGQGGYAVRHVMNITDVGHMVDDSAADGGGEDKMEAARKRLLEDKKSGKLPADAVASFDPGDPYSIAEFYARAFVEDATLMGLKVVLEATEGKKPELLPRPTRFVKPMLEMVMRLIERGHAYVASDGVAYFDTQSFPQYGQLSGNTLEKIRSGAGGRVSEKAQSVKKHPADFMLWKPDPTHLMRWDPSKELGRPVALKEGYPGWHLECSAMAQELLGEVIDLHSGGEDNIFPHHECEIAQSCCAHGSKQFARYWFHPRFLQVEGAKMSKSKGNFFTVRDLVAKGFEPAAIRLELIKTHYRSNANFTEQGLKDSARRIERWRRFAKVYTFIESDCLLDVDEEFGRIMDEFSGALNDDLNIAKAIAVVDQLATLFGIDSFEKRLTGEVRGKIAAGIFESIELPGAPLAPSLAMEQFRHAMETGSSRAMLALLHLFDGVLGVIFRPPTTARPSASGEDAHIDDLVRRRTEARATKNWAEADKIRDELNRLNIAVEDTAQGPKWSRRAGL